MNKALAIKHLYPDADETKDFIVQDKGDGIQNIVIWNLPYPIPTESELNTAFFEVTKAAKIKQFNHYCNKEILSGFQSLNTGNKYGFSELDQMNMTQQMLLFLNDQTLIDVYWKTEDKGIVLHTKEQFMTVVKEADQHKRGRINHYWNKKNEINVCTTIAEVDAVVW